MDITIKKSALMELQKISFPEGIALRIDADISGL
jgi:hypothetical protein